MHNYRNIYFFVTENTARKKWKYLRDQFAVELGKIPPLRSGDCGDSGTMSKWPYFRALMFLKDIVTARQSSGNLCTIASTTIEPGETSVPASETQSTSEQGGNVELETEGCTETFGDGTSGTSSITLPTTSTTPAGKRKRVSTENFNECILNLEKQKVQYLQEKAARQHDDEDLQFFKSLLPHVRRIPDVHKLSFRNKVQELVQTFAYHHDYSPSQHSQLPYHSPSGPGSTLQDIPSTTPVMYELQDNGTYNVLHTPSNTNIQSH